MRRNMGRRGNINSGGGGGGPLMTGHLQDIDLELELLKRKREMIEQQQQLLVMEQQYKNSSRHSYDQMRYDEPGQHGSNRDFNHLYETGTTHRFGRKRQAENQWQYDSAPKRTPPKKKNSSQFNQHSSGNPGPGNFRNQRPTQGSKFSSPRPLMDVKVPKQSIGQKIANQKAPPKTQNKDFTPSKVSKQKAPAAPNKMASHSVTERKSLVAAATESSSDGAVSRMLLPDRVPSQQVSGRLELALGAIMKNIRVLIDGQPKHATVLRSIQLQRVMKQAIRERIRTVMLGKVVGSLVDILAIYREEFPEETDADILNIALEAGGVSASDQNLKTKFIESGDPGDFFRANMTSLLERKLNEMFSKLEDIYANAPSSDDVVVETSEEQIDLQKNADNKDNAENKDKDESNKEYKDFLNTTVKVYDVKRIIPRLMKKYLPYVVKLLNVDGMYQTTKAAITMKTNEKAAKLYGTKSSKEGQGAGNTTAPAEQTPNENRQMYNLPYYVKIMGRPTLPKRKVMQGFLSQFNPKSIKKHRSIHNLLFVGFTEKTDYDVMVAADGAVIGRNTLSIRICKKDGPQESNGENGENNDTSNGVSQEEIKKENDDKNCDIIPSDLDGQITDLLSSIRKSEEENGEGNEENENKGGEAKPEAKDVKMEEEEGDIKNDEEITENAANEENKDEIVDGNVTENITEDNLEDNNIVDENVTEDNLEDNNIVDENVTEDNLEDNNIVDENVTEDNLEDNNIVDENVTEDNLEDNNIDDENFTEDNLEDNNTTSQEEVTDKVETQNTEAANTTEDQNTEATETSDDSKKEENSQDSDDKVGELKGSATGRSTPSRMSARLANVTPSAIRTRRASRLASQN